MAALRQHDHAKASGNIGVSADDVTDLLSQVRLVLVLFKELVVACAGDQLGLRILLFLENIAVAVLVDVEAVFDDGRKFHLEGVIVDFLVASYVDVECGLVCTGLVYLRQ